MKSEARRLDFAGNPSVGRSEINEWAKNKTNGKISQILDPGNPDRTGVLLFNTIYDYYPSRSNNKYLFLGSIAESTAMVLASAVHFQNTWKRPFAETKTAMFCLSAKQHIPIRMMHQTGYFNYYKDERNKFAALELPYDVNATE